MIILNNYLHFLCSDESWFTLKLPSNVEVGAPLRVSVDIEYDNKIGMTMPPQHMFANGTVTSPEMNIVVEGDDKVELNEEVQVTLTALIPQNVYGDMELMVRL